MNIYSKLLYNVWVKSRLKQLKKMNDDLITKKKVESLGNSLENEFYPFKRFLHINTCILRV